MFRLLNKRSIILNPYRSLVFGRSPLNPQTSLIQSSVIRALQIQRLNHNSTAPQSNFIPPPPIKPNTINLPVKRPTKAELLAAATSTTERLLIHLKWPLLRNNRPFTVDEISAFISWFLLSHIVWIILGTTTFVSLLLFSINWLTDSDFTCMLFNQFLSGIIPEFEIYVKGSVKPDWDEGLIKLSQVEVTSDKYDVHLNIDSLKFNLSFHKWQEMKGIYDNLQITGLRGKVNQDSIKELKVNGNLELNNLRIKDSSINILKSNQKTVLFSIYSSTFPKLRQKSLALDILNGSIDGSINNDSLFTIHQKQHNLAYVGDIEDDLSPWKRITRIRLDKIDLDSINIINSEVNQQFNWLTEGKMDLTADILIPMENEDEEYELNNLSKYLVMDMKLQFEDLKTNTISTTKPPLMKSNGEEIITLDNLKPIMNYINTIRAKQQFLPPLSFRVVKPMTELDDSLLDLISFEVYIELIKIVQDYEFNEKLESLKNWSKTVASQLLIVGIGAMA